MICGKEGKDAGLGWGKMKGQFSLQNASVDQGGLKMTWPFRSCLNLPPSWGKKQCRPAWERSVMFGRVVLFSWRNPQGDLTTEACLLAALLTAEEINPSFFKGQQEWNIDLCYWWKAFEFFLTSVSRLSASSNSSCIQLPQNSWLVYEIAKPLNNILNQILQFKLNCLFFLPYPLL